MRYVLHFVVLSLAAGTSFSQELTSGQALSKWLSVERSKRPKLETQSFSDVPMSKRDATMASGLLWDDHVDAVTETRKAEMEKKVIVIGDDVMRFESRTYGKKPENGHSLFISMHGGGGAPAAVNDRQWKNQIELYKPKEGIYVAPRAPSDTWNLWHRSHIDRLFDRLIENLVVMNEVDPNKVYFMGYSAGGDGVYQLAPRMADRLAAAAMMAGHPNDAKPDGLRNIGFTLHMGAKDGAYKRNEVAAEWKTTLAKLQKADPDGYLHHVQLHEGKGHWMDREDAVAVPWMAKFTRNPHPKKVVWRQSSVTHPRFYWLSVNSEKAKKGHKIVASISGQTITIEESEGTKNLTLLLTDTLLDLDQKLSVKQGDKVLFSGKVPRTIQALAKSLASRPDPTFHYWSEVEVKL